MPIHNKNLRSYSSAWKYPHPHLILDSLVSLDSLKLKNMNKAFEEH